MSCNQSAEDGAKARVLYTHYVGGTILFTVFDIAVTLTVYFVPLLHSELIQQYETQLSTTAGQLNFARHFWPLTFIQWWEIKFREMSVHEIVRNQKDVSWAAMQVMDTIVATIDNIFAELVPKKSKARYEERRNSFMTGTGANTKTEVMMMTKTRKCLKSPRGQKQKLRGWQFRQDARRRRPSALLLLSPPYKKFKASTVYSWPNNTHQCQLGEKLAKAWKSQAFLGASTLCFPFYCLWPLQCSI